MNSYLQFYERTKDIVNVITIYTLEAHWVKETVNEEGKKELDGWPIGHSYRIPQHETIDDRIEMANEFIKEFNWIIPTVVDVFTNDFNNVYASWPDRGYIIYENRLIYMSNLNKDGTRNCAWTDEMMNILY